MADIKKNDQTTTQQQTVPVQRGQQTTSQQTGLSRQRSADAYRSPFQLMRDMLRDPFGMMTPLQNDLSAAFEVRETADAFVFEADVPGIKQDDIDVQLHGNRLQVSGKREYEHEDRQNDRYYTYERSYGDFSRVFTLPDNVDLEHVQSTLDNGVLKLHVPKKPGAQPRKIEIGAPKSKA